MKVAVDDLDPLVWTVPQTARLLGLSERTVYDLIAKGEIPAIRVGRRRVVSKLALDRFLNGGE